MIASDQNDKKDYSCKDGKSSADEQNLLKG